MEQASTWVGMDVHKERIAVAVVRGSADRAVEWEVVNEAGAVRRLGRRLKREIGSRRIDGTPASWRSCGEPGC